MRHGHRFMPLCLLAGLAATATAQAGEAPTEGARLWSARAALVERPGLAGFEPDAAPYLATAMNGGEGPTEDPPRTMAPALAGLLSAVLPGAGQLAQGQRRGWIYLGVEAVALFSVWGLRSAANQSEEDYEEYADRHWTWNLYETSTTCGDGLGPIDYEREHAALLDVYQNSRDQYYEDIGRLNVYACGWDALDNRGVYRGMRDDANALFSAARYAVTAAFLNHVVSAVDAAKSASNRRKANAHALRMNWNATPSDVAVRVELARSF